MHRFALQRHRNEKNVAVNLGYALAFHSAVDDFDGENVGNFHKSSLLNFPQRKPLQKTDLIIFD